MPVSTRTGSTPAKMSLSELESSSSISAEIKSLIMALNCEFKLMREENLTR